MSDVKAWIADHDGRNDAYWEAQHSLNGKTEESLDMNALRLAALEKRIVWITGFAAAVGAGIGSAIRFWS